MKMALSLARKGRGRTSPNPMVGALVVAGGEILGRGWHKGPGHPHAEVVALQEAGLAAGGATVYTTLEPCVHLGLTPPCTHALTRAGVRRVVAATQDPDRRVAGKGFEALRSSGIDVQVGCLGTEAEFLNAAYLMHRARNRPLVTYKAAATLDGKTSAGDGSSKWITGPEARADVHRLRAASDAVCIGIGTVLADDPSLTARTARVPSRRPLRVVVDSAARTPLSASVLDASAGTLVAVTQEAPESKINALRAAGAEVVVVEAGQGHVSLPELLRELAGRGVMSLLLEGGPVLAAGFKSAGAIDRYVLYFAGKLVADGAKGILAGPPSVSIELADSLDILNVKRLGPDVRIEASPAPRPGAEVTLPVAVEDLTADSPA